VNWAQVVIGALVLASAVFMAVFNGRMGRTGLGRWFGPVVGAAAGCIFMARGLGWY
jgi:hypothetical protein